MPAADPSGPRPVRAPRGTALSCRGWPQEAAMRMLMNNLDPEVAEHPDQLIVYGGSGRAARSWPAYDAIVRTLQDLQGDETLLVQSGKPVGVMRTHEWAPRVLIANSNLVPQWATWEEFRRLESLGLTMYGQMTAGSWIYIGTQGILQGTYETFAAVAAKRFGGSLAGTITLTAGLGGMGGAQPLAVTMNGGVAIVIDCDPSRIARRIEYGYLDEAADDVDDALRRATAARDAGEPLSIGLLGNAAELLPRMLAMGAPIDVVTDQTSAHDPLTYLPRGVAFEDMAALRAEDPAGFTERARQSMAAHVEAMVGFMDAGAEVFDYGNSIRGEAELAGYSRAFDFPGFVPAYIRPLFCEGRGPFRWAALSGDPADIAATDAAILDLFPDNEPLARWIRMAQEKVHFQGLPGADLLARLRRAEPGRAAVQRAGRAGRRPGPDRDRPGPPRLRVGGLALPRDRGDGRRVGRDRRLAAAERAGQHGLRGVLGEHPPRRRGGHRPVHPRGPGVRGRRHAAGRGEAGAGADQRPGDGRDPARGRRIRGGGRGGRAAGRARPDAAVSTPPPVAFASLWESLLPIGRVPGTGGYRRYSWTPADLDCRAWFVAAARDRQLRLDPDRNGNLWAWWDVSGSPGRAGPRDSDGESPGLGAGRRRLRRAARRGVRVRRDRRAPRRGLRPVLPDRGGRVHRGGRGPVRGRLPGQPPADRRDRPRAGPGTPRRRRGHAGRRCRRPGRIPAISAATRT